MKWNSKWEDKKFRDFPMPKGYTWAEYFDVVELVNKEKLEFTKPNKEKLEFTKPNEETYICKNPFKQIKILFVWVVLGLCP